MATGGPSATTDKKEDVAALEQKVMEMSIQQVVKGADAEANRASVSLRGLCDIAEHRINELAYDVTALRKKGDEVEKELERKTGELQSLTQSVNGCFENARELFSVRRLDPATTQQDKAMIFKEVDINEGSYYELGTGEFTAPWPGMYLLSAGVKNKHKGKPVEGHIMVDDVQHRVVQCDGDGGSGFVMAQLKAEQIVWVKAVSPVDEYGERLGNRNWFRVTLVQRQ